MQKLVRAAAVAFALSVALVAGAAAAESGPARVYSDFARDGILECSHSETDLRAVLNDASIYQYSDPVTLNRLKLAIRRQLAEGCPGITKNEGSGFTDGWMVLIGAVLLLLTLGSGGWAARRTFQGRG